MSTPKEKFMAIWNAHIAARPGADKLLEWLEKSDYFIAPASTRYHLAREGGLLEHSLNVYERLSGLCVREEMEYSGGRGWTAPGPDSIAIVGLLHDVCKVSVYKPGTRNVKNEETGQWEKVPTYTFEDNLPYGHGEKSVYIVSGFMKLTREEAMAIRWHMGPWQEGESRDAGNAFARYPLAVLTHIADMQATYLDENEEKAGGQK